MSMYIEDWLSSQLHLLPSFLTAYNDEQVEKNLPAQALEYSYLTRP